MREDFALYRSDERQHISMAPNKGVYTPINPFLRCIRTMEQQ
jgi:hypothetical protein